MRTLLSRSIFAAIVVSGSVFAQSASSPNPKEKTAPPAEQLAKPEADRAIEPDSRQPSLSFSDPNREQLQQRIETALHNEPSLSGAQLTVNISDNAIDLSGNASTNKQRLAARRIVQSFAGNMRVREQITVPSATPTKGNAVAEPSPGTPSPGNPGTVAKQRDQDPNLPHTDPKKDGDKSENPRR